MISMQWQDKHDVRIIRQRILINVVIGINLIVRAMNMTRHDDRRSSPPQGKLYFFDTLTMTSPGAFMD
jgi:hypothetical protein